MVRILSLRGVISAVAALSVAVVASLTLGLTLTSSLAALRDIGKDHALSLLTNARLSTEHLLNRPQDSIRTIQQLAQTRRWGFPSDDPATTQEFLSAVRALALHHDGMLQLLLYFADNTRVQAITTNVLGQHEHADFIALSTQRMSSWTAANQVSENQTVVGYDREVIVMRDYSLLNETDSMFDIVAPVATEKPRLNGMWENDFMIVTAGGVASVNVGIIGAATLNYTTSLLTYGGPCFRRGDPVQGSSVFGFVVSSIGDDSLDGFLRSTKATPNTNAFTIDTLGYLMASSMPREYQRVTPSNPGDVLQPGCASTDRGGAAGGVGGTFHICRTHARDYGYAPLATIVDQREFAFATTPTVRLLDVRGKAFFAASAPVPQQFIGWSPQLLLLMPEEDVIGDVVRTRNTAIGVTCAVFVVVAALIFVTISLLLAPLSRVADRMVRASNFEDDEEDASVSAMAEVAELQEAYYAMNDELNRIRAYVPQSVLVAKRQADASDEGDLDADEVLSTARSGYETTLSQVSHGSHRSRSSRKSDRLAGSAALDKSGGAGSASAAQIVTLINSKPVAVLVANARGFAAFAARASAAQVASAIAQLVDSINDAVTKNGGVLGAFHGDHFTATFNAVKPCVGFVRKAVTAALDADLTIAGSQSGLSGSRADLGVRCGVATGTCLVGNVGSAAAKGFSTIGSAFTQALVLERLTRVYGERCRVLTTSRVCNDVSTTMSVRFVDIVALPGKRAVLLGTVLGPIATSSGGTGDNSTAAKDEEWLYLVGAQATADGNATHNEAFTSLYQRDLEACAKAIQHMNDEKQPPVSAVTDTAPIHVPENAPSSTGGVNADADEADKPGNTPAGVDTHASPAKVDGRLLRLYQHAASSDGTAPPVSELGMYYDQAVGYRHDDREPGGGAV